MMKGRYTIKEPVTASEWDTYLRIRFEVLRKPWGQPFESTKDETDDESFHLLVIDEFGDGVAAGRLQFNSTDQAQIRSMAVVPHLRGSGIGTLLISELEKKAKSSGCKEVILDSREGAVDFYLANGYAVMGDSYLLFGIIPHKAMKKVIG
ncbi:MAG: GNAT family N-acetyltransferase [Bacteroidota bacterium]